MLKKLEMCFTNFDGWLTRLCHVVHRYAGLLGAMLSGLSHIAMLNAWHETCDVAGRGFVHVVGNSEIGNGFVELYMLLYNSYVGSWFD